MRVMRLASLVAAVSLTAALPSVAAPPREATLKDARGDWPVESVDIVSVRLGTARVSGYRAVRTVITLASAPTDAAKYTLAFGHGCDIWYLSATRIPTESAYLEHGFCENSGGQQRRDRVMASVTYSGNDVTITALYAPAFLPVGQTISWMAVDAAVPQPQRVRVGDQQTVGEGGWIGTGDHARGAVSLVLR